MAGAPAAQPFRAGGFFAAGPFGADLLEPGELIVPPDKVGELYGLPPLDHGEPDCS
ncbi:hypothetical protein O4215_20530 [Rhodococcus maanshanensis]|uniref:hypothetical protein n=1 Tax=Rhodococcus maanshanensis TaxID=183556 RepID=UPI0022B582B1|nr:hypothetical protein [Rhodococcus maanshanensis]MCZ4557951.1 hypothetical protein [Rhodococcus maanshanensis]